MRALLKTLHSPDVVDLIAWTPDREFGLLVTAMIGPSNTDDAESFDFTVCTPGWFARRLGNGSVRSGAHTLFVETYDYRALKSFIENAVQRTEGDS